MRSLWQRLGRLLAAVANWRYFYPAVFVACAIPALLPAFDFARSCSGITRTRSASIRSRRSSTRRVRTRLASCSSRSR